jgi:hypothetical protein
MATSQPPDIDRRPPQAIYYPAITWDYYLSMDPDPAMGIGLVANRKIKKGELVFGDSIEFIFSDIREGDYLLLQGHRKASKKSGTKVPPKMPITRDMLLRSHGVPALIDGTICWRLESPGMLMNHSCDPNVIDDSHDACRGEGYAARDIRKGEPLTYNYVLQYYGHGPFFEKCYCSSHNCLGKMNGFKDLSEADKAKYLSKASTAVQALYKADVGEGTRPKEVLAYTPPPASLTNPAANNATRLVFPGPSYALAEVAVRQNDAGEWTLYAAKDFAFGQRVYEFWRCDWPFGGRNPIDMVASTKLGKDDLPEGTVINVDPNLCAAKKDRSGHYQFSGFDLFVAHSCEPILTYNDIHEDEDDEWQGAYATRDIKSGEVLTIDFNSVFWDRSSSPGARECHCGSSKCVGTKAGFKFLPTDAQEERKLMTWRRVLPPYEGEKEADTKYLGMALTPHVRESWREDSKLGCDCPDTAPSSSSSSGSSSSSESSDDSETSDDDGNDSDSE